MASSNIYLDKRNKKASSYPLTISISANSKTILIPTGLHLKRDEWRGGQVIGRADKNRLNSIIRGFHAKVDSILVSLMMTGQVRMLSSRELKAEILRQLHPQVNSVVYFRDVADDFLKSKKGRTLEIYLNTLKKIYRYASDDLPLEEITPVWLQNFENYLSAKQHTNSIAIDLRNIRAIFNHARRIGKTREYPFLNYRIKKAQTRHRNNPPELICALKNWAVEKHQEKYRDIYMLIFYLIGINIVDLCHAKNSDVVQGRLEYTRRKTKKLYSVLIQPEAQDIIDRYRGKVYLLNILENVSDYRYFAKALNRNLREIGYVHIEGKGGKKHRTPILPENTTYWARHSWATIAHRIGIPKDTISMALGHSFGVSTTDTYIDYNAELVDHANRKVIDYINTLEVTCDFSLR